MTQASDPLDAYRAISPDSEILRLDGLGAALRDLRNALQLSGPAFAEKLDIDVGTLSKYELDRRAIPFSLIEDIAAVTGQSASAILIWCMRRRFSELGDSFADSSSFLHTALQKLERSLRR
jgi:transcriptional regulator with XRE-family HTH domain